MVNKIENNNADEMKRCKLAVVDYSASWCGPCKMMAPVFHMIAEELEGKTAFFSADVDENPSLAVENKIFSVPTVIVYKNGVEADRSVGAIGKTELRDIVEKHMN